MKKIAFLAFILLGMAGTSLAQNALTVADTNIPQGGQGQMVVSFRFANEGEIAAYQFELALPEGVSLIPNGKRYYYEKGDGYNAAHQISINYVESEGIYTVACVSLSGTYAFTATSGTLITLPLQADESLLKGTTMNASLKNINLSTIGSSNISLADVSFRIVIGEASDIRTELFETSTTAPEAASNVNVRVYRTINANEWSTICLPFAMTEAQVKSAFGDDVELGDFNGYEAINEGDDVVGLSVNFNNASAIAANHPYIIKVSSPVTEFTVDGVDIDPEDEPTVAAVKRTKKQWSEMIGTYVANTVLEATNLFLSDNKFWYSAGSTKMKAFRAYFDFYDVLTVVEEAYSSRIAMTFSDEQTGINDMECEATNDNRYYDLQGRRINGQSSMDNGQLKKGIYIVNGKKVVNK